MIDYDTTFRGAIDAPTSPYTTRNGTHVFTIDYAKSVAECVDKSNSSLIQMLRYNWTKFHVRILEDMQRRQGAPVPADVTEQAAKYAPRLTALMSQSVARMVRHQSYGSLDTSKLVRLARPSSPMQFERDAATAFRRRDTVTAPRPLKIAIIGDANNEIRVRNPTYMHALGTVSHILTTAAGGAGLQAACYLSRGRFRESSDYGHAARAAGHHGEICVLSRISDYGTRISPNVFRAIVHTFGFAVPFLNCIPHGGTSHNGTGAIDYAREHDKATFVVAIGTFYDAAKADVHLSPSLSVDAMVSEIEAGLRAYVSGQRAA
jgi:hypothetical protein